MSVILGVNHQFLYPDAIVDGDIHTQTLKKLSANPLVDALDCWMWRGERADEERRILLDSGKVINYNIGDRFGEDIAFPSSKNRTDRDRAYDLMMREISYALSVGSKKIIFGSGPDDTSDHDGAKERFGELILKISAQLPSDVEFAFEPTDWDIDKHFLFGPLDETVEFINNIRHGGFERIGLLIDMCHVPIMHETLESALVIGGEVLNHVHLGNCVIKNPKSRFYGDKHIPWDYPESEYGAKDGIRFIRMLGEIGYLDNKDATVSFEMRPYEELSAEESLERFVLVYKEAISQ